MVKLDNDPGSKLEYPKLSGKPSECFLKVRDEVERVLVPKVDQVDKMREQFSGFAPSLVPDSMKDTEVAFQALVIGWETRRESWRTDSET